MRASRVSQGQATLVVGSQGTLSARTDGFGALIKGRMAGWPSNVNQSRHESVKQANASEGERPEAVDGAVRQNLGEISQPGLEGTLSRITQSLHPTPGATSRPHQNLIDHLLQMTSGEGWSITEGQLNMLGSHYWDYTGVAHLSPSGQGRKM